MFGRIRHIISISRRRLVPIILTVSSLIAVLLPTMSATGCGAADSPRWIFLITLDTTRADGINYAPGNPQTPNLAALAAQGQYFENAYALIPITLPSHAGMFYSQPPHRLKIYNNGRPHTVNEPSLAQLLKGKGFSTGAVISLGVLKAEFGLNKGFDSYIENFPPALWTKDAEAVNRDAFEAINKTKDHAGPFFYWLHYSDPHEPYFPPHPEGTGLFTITAQPLNSSDSVASEQTLFTSRCSQQPVVNVTFTLSPGKTRLVLNTDVPQSFRNRSDCKCQLQYIKYRDFQLTETNPDPDAKQTVTGITLPQSWNQGKSATGISYYADNQTSEILMQNNSKKAVQMTLRFMYSMQVDDQTRRVFYNEEIRYVDQQIGRLLTYLKEKGIYEQAAFVIMGDHGETLGEYQEHFGHIHYLNQSSMHVPLILSGRRIKPSGKRAEAVSTLNIAPTILDLANIKKPNYMLGRTLLKPIKNTRLLLETYSPEAYFDAFSLIEFPYQAAFYPGRRKEKIEFYNLKTGTSGKTARQEKDGEKKRIELVNELLKISRIITATKGKVGKTSSRHQEILKSLGYL